MVKNRLLSLITSLLLVTWLTCSQKVYAGVEELQHAMQVMQMVKEVTHTQPVILNPLVREKIEKLYLEVISSVPFQINTELIRQHLMKSFSRAGYTVVDDPVDAGYVVQVNITKFYHAEEKKSGGFLGAIGAQLGGYAGLVMGAGAGSAIGMQVGSKLGAALGEKAGETVEKTAKEAVMGKVYVYMGVATVNVIENFQGKMKEITGTYPLLGKGKGLVGDILSEAIARNLDVTLVKSFEKRSTKKTRFEGVESKTSGKGSQEAGINKALQQVQELKEKELRKQESM